MHLTLPWKRRTKSDHPPVFVRGLSRSGGTLMVTVLDAHPEIAMSYELYPELLRRARAAEEEKAISGTEHEGTGPEEEPVDAEALERLMRRAGRKVLAALADAGLTDIRTFVARAARSGIDPREFARFIRDHRLAGRGFATLQDRLHFVERLSLEKMARSGKRIWGLKCSGQFEAYLSVWPNAFFLNMVRDGRDVLASQQNTGSFTAAPAEVGREWADTHLAFRALVDRPGVNALEVSYEALVQEPEAEIRRICDFLGVAFSPQLLTYHERDLSIYKKPQGHLSIDRISKPIDDSKIGRWRQDLSEEDVAAFLSTAGEAMRSLGYLEA